MSLIEEGHDPQVRMAYLAIVGSFSVNAAYRDRKHWLRMSILNTAHSGHFSSDRTIGEYNRDIWHLESVAPKS
jgi:glycogen phosphorylase